MHACDALGVSPCFVLSFLATNHLDDGMDMETVWIPDTLQKAYLEEWQRVDDGQNVTLARTICKRVPALLNQRSH